MCSGAAPPAMSPTITDTGIRIPRMQARPLMMSGSNVMRSKTGRVGIWSVSHKLLRRIQPNRVYSQPLGLLCILSLLPHQAFLLAPPVALLDRRALVVSFLTAGERQLDFGDAARIEIQRQRNHGLAGAAHGADQ